MTQFYKVNKALDIGEHRIYPSNIISLESTAVMDSLVKAGLVEKTKLPSEPCYWCGKKGLPGDKFWINHRMLWKCKTCFSPESFPSNDIMSVCYATYTLNAEKKPEDGITVQITTSWWSKE